MFERHYDDESLITLLDASRAAGDAHLPDCGSCSGRLESFGLIAGALRHADVWETRELQEEPVPSTIANLRAFADRMAWDDTRAEAMMATLLAGSREEWMPRLLQHPEYRTAGMVRKLLEAARTAFTAVPLDAVALTQMATDIADHLDADQHEADVVARLRGAAWRDKGYAFFTTGHFSEALEAVDRAELELADCVVDEYDRARLNTVRAIVLRPFERTGDALAASSTAAKSFASFGDVSRYVSSRMVEALILVNRAEYQNAVSMLDDLEKRFGPTLDVYEHSAVLSNLGFCHAKTGRHDAALRCYDAATAMLRGSGHVAASLRIRWTAAQALAAAGQHESAFARFEEVRMEFDRLGMTAEYALAGLDVAELLLVENRFAEVVEICRSSMASFERAGLAHTGRAMAALAFMQEAAQQRRASLALLSEVREYIRKLPEQPNLLFAPSSR